MNREIYTRREVLKMMAATGAAVTAKGLEGLLGGIPRVEARGQIVPVEYVLSRGRHQSFPWGPISPDREGEEATGLTVGGPADKLDTLDIQLNGSYSKAAQRQMLTRDVLLMRNRNLQAAGVDITSTGDCRDGGAASYFSPLIERDIVLGGMLFTKRDRMTIARWAYGGLAMDPYYPEMNDEAVGLLGAHIANGEPVIANWSDDPNQEWWGIALDILPDGRLVIARHLRWQEEDGLKLEREFIRAAGVLKRDRPQPGFEGSFDLVNKEVAGLIIGTHRLVA